MIIRNGAETILFDTPASVGEMLNEKRIFQISAIFLSHKHYDHIAGITEFEYWSDKIPVYGNISVLGNFEITDRLYEQCKFHVLHDRESVKVGRIKVTPFDVSHKIPTFGLIFRYEDKRIVHFSDSGNTKLSDYQRLQVKQAQLVILMIGSRFSGIAVRKSEIAASGPLVPAFDAPQRRPERQTDLAWCF